MSAATSARILIATDLSDASEEALRHAAKYEPAELALVHVMPNLLEMQPLFPQEAGAHVPDVASLEAKVLSALEGAARKATSKPIEVFLEQGDASECIAKRANDWKAELIVVGSHGRSGISRLLLGSVAEGLAKEAPCSVLVARRHVPGPVIVATDLSEAAGPLLTVGAHEAKTRGTKLVVVHVVDHALADFATSALAQFVGVLTPSTGSALLDETRAAAAAKIDAQLQRLNITADVEVVDGAAATALVRVASKRNADLVVVGAHARADVTGMLLGSVTARVLRTAECSVLVVRQ